MTSLILRTATRFMLPLLFLFSLFLLYRGHNQPGGGFSGGLIAASAFVLYGLAFGATAAKKIFPIQPSALVGTGLLIAASSGLIGMLRGMPFMTGTWVKVIVPDVGTLELGTPVLFDVGVYLVVVGIAVIIILPLMEQ